MLITAVIKAMSTLYRIACALTQKPYRIGLLFTKGSLISAGFLQRSDAAPGGGVLPYMGHIGMCRCEGYGFQAVYSSIGYINQSVWVWNRLSFFTKLTSWLTRLRKPGIYSSIGNKVQLKLILV